MNSSRVWELLRALDGVADETSVGRLGDSLAAEEERELGEAVRDLVDGLLERCHVTHDHWGEVSEAVAAAVLARGRDTYERVHTTGGVLDPDDWAWQEADALLALGEPAEGTGPFVLQWLTEDLPAGVRSAWRTDHPPLDDDPSWGVVPAADPAWDSACETLLVDPGVAHARRSIGEAHGTSYDRVAVWLTLSDTAEPTITVWADGAEDDDPSGGDAGDSGDDGDDGDGEVVLVGTYPAADLRDVDVRDRTAAYVEIVAGLLQVVDEDG
ncbi:hypothetical protein [uncultured Nocardioides sp.]|uniref:hypothetical protein n=1 Tax=uncultured Nocardioides sp. TaxID=198441 RepID=UPI0026317DDA|nr:hypothetical protein [uncultured Nocardioides sp.]